MFDGSNILLDVYNTVMLWTFANIFHLVMLSKKQTSTAKMNEIKIASQLYSSITCLFHCKGRLLFITCRDNYVPTRTLTGADS